MTLGEGGGVGRVVEQGCHDDLDRLEQFGDTFSDVIDDLRDLQNQF